jgi:hypothetical protein
VEESAGGRWCRRGWNSASWTCARPDNAGPSGGADSRHWHRDSCNCSGTSHQHVDEVDEVDEADEADEVDDAGVGNVGDIPDGPSTVVAVAVCRRSNLGLRPLLQHLQAQAAQPADD